MSEKTKFNDFAPAPQTADQAVIEEELARQRLNRALGKDVDETEIASLKDLQDTLASRPPEGSYQEYVDVEAKEPLNEGVFTGDVFYKDDAVYSITARSEAGDQVMVTVVTSKSHEAGVDETQLMTEDEARKLLDGAELVDSGVDRENAAFTSGTLETKSDAVVTATSAETTQNSTNFTELSVDEQRKLLRTLFGKELVDQLSDADLAKYAAVGSELPGKQTTAEATPESAKLTDEQKAELKKDVEKTILHDIEVDADFKDNDAFIAKLTELRDNLVNGTIFNYGGITVDEANDAIQSVLDKNYKEAPRLFEAAAATIDSDTDNAASDELLKDLQMTPEERKNRDLLKIYRNASDDERRRINEIAWGENLENPLEGYDPEIARNISDEDAIELMRNAFENGYKLPIDAADSDAEPQDDDSDAEQDSSDDETEQQDAPTGFLNRLRSRWDNMENRRKKVTRAIGGIVLTAAGITMAVLIAKNGGDHSAALDAANNLQSTGIKPSEHANDPQAFANFAGSLKDLHVGAGQGVYDVLAHNGIDKSKVSYAELYDLQRQFPKELYLQQVGNVTDVRITSPGNLSQPLADALAKLASN